MQSKTSEPKSEAKKMFYVIVDRQILLRDSNRNYTHAIVARNSESDEWRAESWSSNIDLARERAKRISHDWKKVLILEARSASMRDLRYIRDGINSGVIVPGAEPSIIVKEIGSLPSEEVSDEFSRNAWKIVSDQYNKKNQEAAAEKLQGGEPIVVKPQPLPEPEPVTDEEKLQAIQSLQDIPGLAPMLDVLKALNPELYNKALKTQEPEPEPQPEPVQEETQEESASGIHHNTISGYNTARNMPVSQFCDKLAEATNFERGTLQEIVSNIVTAARLNRFQIPMPQDEPQPVQEFRIDLNPERFVGNSSLEPSEEEVYRYLVDLLNEAGLDSELRYRNGEYKIAVGSALISVPPVVMDGDRLRVLVQVAQGLADELDGTPEYESWFAYRKGTYFLCVNSRRV